MSGRTRTAVSASRKDTTDRPATDAYKTSREQPSPKKSNVNDRPEWNSDTKIEGYDDVDEHGRYRRRGAEWNRKKTQGEQEKLNQEWLNSLRSGFHEK
ncbi:hypothetical protein Q1695_009815 [Nippostrongylus brasiliensis]|nr:hypothetical protein Q1695_009815 [Nippostrongylus brasiliensis]